MNLDSTTCNCLAWRTPSPRRWIGVLGVVWAAWILWTPPAWCGETPPPEISFPAITHDGSFSLFNLWEPNPNPYAAVGPDHLVSLHVTHFQVADHTGAVLLEIPALDFWTDTSGWEFNPLTGAPYDQRVIYDAIDDRWIALAGANAAATNALLVVAVSETGDPTGDWDYYQYPADANGQMFVDFPTPGLNRKWLTVYSIMKLNSIDQIVQGYLYTFDRTNLYATGASPTLFELSINEYSMAPMLTWDPNQEELFILHPVPGKPSPHIDVISGPAHDPDLTLNVATAEVADAWAGSWSSGYENFIPQLGTTNELWIHSQLSSGIHRNGYLWFCQTIFLPEATPARSAVQWWQLTTNGEVVQRGRIDDPINGTFYGTPSMAVNQYNDVLISFASFSSNQYATANYALRLGTDPPNTLRPPQVLKSGEAPYVREDIFGRSRWGPTSSTGVNPNDDTSFWSLQSYAASPSNNWGTWWGKIPVPEVDLSLECTISSSSALVGESLVCHVVVSNAGPFDATSASITNLVPAGFVVGEVVSSQGTCQVEPTRVTCGLGILASGDTASASFELIALAPGTWSNRVSASAWPCERDLNPLNNTQMQPLSVTTAPDLRMVATDRSDPVLNGADHEYLVTVLNGITDASSVVVTSILPSSVEFAQAVTSHGFWVESNGLVRCEIGSLSAGEVATLSLTVVPQLPGTLTNHITLTAAGVAADTSNRVAAVVSTVHAGTDIGLIKFADRPTPIVGETIQFFMIATNRGPMAASSVTISELLHDGLRLTGASTTRGTYDDDTGTWDVGALPVGGVALLTITSVVEPGTSGMALTNTADVVASDPPDSRPDNNRGKAIVFIQGADIAVGIVDGPDPSINGADITYSITVTNRGPGLPDRVLGLITSSTNLARQSVSTTHGSCTSLNGITFCELGPMTNGEVATITMVARPLAEDVHLVTAFVSSEQFDPVTNNSSAIVLSESVDVANLWINEFDYDTPAFLFETNEWVELVGEAGVSLDGYALLTWTAAGNLRGLYRLDGTGWTFTDEGDGFGVCVVGQVAAGEGQADVTPALWKSGVIPNGNGSSIQLVRTSKLNPPFYVNVHQVDYPVDNLHLREDQIAPLPDFADPLTSVYLTGWPGTRFGDYTWTNGVGRATPGMFNQGQRVGLDTDGDGLPDAWEFEHFASLTHAPDDDADGDLMSNADEYIADTEPTNEASLFRLTIDHAPGGVVISFPTSSNRLYGLDRVNDVANGSWTSLVSHQAGPGGPWSLVEFNPPPAAVYRGTVSLP